MTELGNIGTVKTVPFPTAAFESRIRAALDRTAEGGRPHVFLPPTHGLRPFDKLRAGCGLDSCAAARLRLVREASAKLLCSGRTWSSGGGE